MFGVDEAGKGPVLGPMVIGAVYVENEEELPDGLADSKKLSETKRESLDSELRENPNVKVATVLVSTDEIDEPDSNMNTLTVEAQSEVIDKLDIEGHGIVDASDTDEERFARRILENSESDISVTAEHGADDEYDIVAAASVIAKVKRDTIVEQLNEEYDGNIGSGYPSDPNTRSFLKEFVQENGSLPECTRESWKTASDIMNEASQQSLDNL